jgi:hypothetical protein
MEDKVEKEELDRHLMNIINSLEQSASNMQSDLQKIHHIICEGLTYNDDLMEVVLDIKDITQKYIAN